MVKIKEDNMDFLHITMHHIKAGIECFEALLVPCHGPALNRVRSNLSILFFSHRTIFFSHNKLGSTLAQKISRYS